MNSRVFLLIFGAMILVNSIAFVRQSVQLSACSARLFRRALTLCLFLGCVYTVPVILLLRDLSDEKPVDPFYGINWGCFYVMFTLVVFTGVMTLCHEAYQQGVRDGAVSAPPAMKSTTDLHDVDGNVSE